MHRPLKNPVVYSALVSLLQGWGLNLVIIIKVKVGTGEKEVIVIIIKEFIMGIHTLELNLFKLIAYVSHYKVYRQELKLIAIYLTTL